MTPLQLAARAAEAEAAALLAEAQHAMTLEDTSPLMYDQATDAINAYNRGPGACAGRPAAGRPPRWRTTTLADTTHGRRQHHDHGERGHEPAPREADAG